MFTSSLSVSVCLSVCLLSICLLLLQEEAAKYESSVTEMRRLMADVEKECSEAEAQLVDVRYALHASETRMKENQQKMKHWKKEVEPLNSF